MRVVPLSVVLPVALSAVLSGASVCGADDGVDYLRDVKPLLSARCYACHSALKQESDLRLDTAALALHGGSRGPAFTPGNSGQSLILVAVTGAGDIARMPPAGQGEPLTETEIALLRAWIDAGAAHPADEQPMEDPRLHWAFQPPARPPVPTPTNASWIRNPIDAFLAAAHESHGVVPAPPAEKHALLRRVSLDLTGLPPTREDLHAFVADERPDAYEQAVERLLASPQYGERWARHWMDVWRYSDWYGRRAVPDVWNSAPQVWRWRDWIVQSLNADQGYDRMVQEMLAADEIAPGDDAAVVATGYLVRNWYALNYNQWMKDLVEHTGKAFLGLTLNCCHCHDHKYDPISQEEYFRFRAFFEPLELRQDRLPGQADCGPFQKYEYTVLRKVQQDGLIRVFDERPEAPTLMYMSGDERAVIEGKPPVLPGAPAALGGDGLAIQPISLPPAAFYPGLRTFIRQDALSAKERAVATAATALAEALGALSKARQPTGSSSTATDEAAPDEAALHAAERQAAIARTAFEAAEAALAAVQARIAADEAKYAQPPVDAAQDLALAAEQSERTAAVESAAEAALRAEAELTAAQAAVKPEDEATRQAAAVAEQKLAAAQQALTAAQTAAAAAPTGTYAPLSPVYPPTSTGRRAALARWIAARENPLAARVAVNHIWAWHFGRPLVATVFDFGRNGKRPTHPELLDWLAVEFMESGWSMKHLNRLIVTSAAYRLASSAGEASAANLALDADNAWLWRFNSRRMESEVLRDCLLFAAGELDLALGGQPFENAQEMISRRRSLYFSVYPEGGGHPQFLETFDAPDPGDCYRRAESVVPQQALAMTNGPLTLHHSRILAGKLWRQMPSCDGDDAAREALFVTAAFEQILSCPPTDAEAAACREFLARQAALLQSAPAEQIAVPPAEGIVAAAADPAQRAREGLVRALFSHNDFVTVR